MSAINVEGQLYAKLSAAAANQGKSVDDYASEVLEREVLERNGAVVEVHLEEQNGLLVFVSPPGSPPITSEAVRAALDEEGF